MTPLIERQVIDRLVGIAERTADPSFLEGVFGLYLEHTPPLLADLGEAARRGDRSTAARIAHRIKGSSLSVGGAGMAKGCIEMEQLCGAATFEPVVASAHVDKLRGTFEATASALRRIAAEAARHGGKGAPTLQ